MEAAKEAEAILEAITEADLEADRDRDLEADRDLREARRDFLECFRVCRAILYNNSRKKL